MEMRKMSDNQQANDSENARSGQNDTDGNAEAPSDEMTQDIPLHYEDAMDEAEGETIETITSKADMIVLEMEDGGRLELDGVVDTPVPMWYSDEQTDSDNRGD